MAWALGRFDYLVAFSAASHAGNVRTNNEDAWRIEPVIGAFAVADGMGGHAAGEVASRLAVDTTFATLSAVDAASAFDAYVAAPTLDARRAVFERMHVAVVAAHEAVVSHGSSQPAFKGMGCTLDLAVLLGEHAFVAHVGDSRVYLARAATTIQLTHDHTVAGALVAKGIATPTQPPHGAHALTNAVGKKGAIKVDDSLVELTSGDRLVLCSDGIYGELKDESLVGRYARQGTTDEAAVALVNAALDRGGHDNATALVVEVGQRRLSREAFDGGLAARDASYARHSPLITGLPEAHANRALSAAVEVQFEAGSELPRFYVEDRVAYIVLEGIVTTPQGWTLGPSGFVYAESLAGGGRGTAVCRSKTLVRALRIRSDDFREICASDPALGSLLYERLARCIARILS